MLGGMILLLGAMVIERNQDERRRRCLNACMNAFVFLSTYDDLFLFFFALF